MGCTPQQHRIRVGVFGNNVSSGPKSSDKIRKNKVPDPESHSCYVNVLKLVLIVIFTILGVLWAGNVAKVQNVGGDNNPAASSSVATAATPAMVVSSLLILFSIISSSSSCSVIDKDVMSPVYARDDLIGWIEADHLNMADHEFEINHMNTIHTEIISCSAAPNMAIDQSLVYVSVSILELETRRKEFEKMVVHEQLASIPLFVRVYRVKFPLLEDKNSSISRMFRMKRIGPGSKPCFIRDSNQVVRARVAGDLPVVLGIEETEPKEAVKEETLIQKMGLSTFQFNSSFNNNDMTSVYSTQMETPDIPQPTVFFNNCLSLEVMVLTTHQLMIYSNPLMSRNYRVDHYSGQWGENVVCMVLAEPIEVSQQAVDRMEELRYGEDECHKMTVNVRKMDYLDRNVFRPVQVRHMK